MSLEVVLEAENLSKSYKSGRTLVKAVQNIDLKLYEAEMVFLYGPSGSGKSTLLNLLSGLDSPTEGTIKFMGTDITNYSQRQLTKYREKYVGFVFQAWELIDNLTAVENVEIPMYPSKMSSEELRTESISLLRRLELLDKEYRYPKEMSGGEQQRVAIARALVKQPKVIFADEPTGNLDSTVGEMIMRMLKTISRQGRTIVIATHNEELKHHADRIIRLHDGQIMGIGSE